jgi:1-acyl-sn-glycerol-3-phosphate acyltransferase
VIGARLRLASLWVSQVARILADNCLRVFIVLRAAEVSAAAGEFTWDVAAALFVLPALVLAPVNGALGNSLPKRLVLAAAAAFCLGAVGIFAVTGGPWLACLGVVALGNALYSPARYALLPAAAQDARLPLARVNAWIEMGAVSAVVAGLVLGGELHAVAETVTIMVILALNVVGLLAAVPAWFPSDVSRPESPGRALLGFFRDSRRVWRRKETRGCLLAVAALRGLVLAASGLVLAVNLGGAAPDFHALLTAAMLVLLGAAGGSLLAGVQGHPTRVLGVVPFAATGLCACLAAAALVQPVPAWLYVLVGLMGGLVNVPLLSTYQASLPADARGNGLALLNMAGYAAMSVLALGMAGLARGQLVSLSVRIGILAVLAAVGAGVAWRVLLRDSYEQVLEMLFAPFYRVRGYGPGLGRLPREGPLLVVANHSAWLDPAWLSRVVPRRLVALLTSQFYDLPVLHFLAVYVVHAIRVEDSSFRREAPELDQAISALDRGECVLIFPEGQMRKKADRLLYRFGRGVWHVLQARPSTPVVVCWIEGGWGSYVSYFNGPPAKNKRVDFWRRIRIGVQAAEVLDKDVLADHRATRDYLMRRCLEARQYLGLPPEERGQGPGVRGQAR